MKRCMMVGLNVCLSVSVCLSVCLCAGQHTCTQASSVQLPLAGFARFKEHAHLPLMTT